MPSAQSPLPLCKEEPDTCGKQGPGDGTQGFQIQVMCAGAHAHSSSHGCSGCSCNWLVRAAAGVWKASCLPRHLPPWLLATFPTAASHLTRRQPELARMHVITRIRTWSAHVCPTLCPCTQARFAETLPGVLRVLLASPARPV